MIRKSYVVTGEDVNDLMVMEDTAYISYTLRLLYRFLFDNGFSKERLNAWHVSLQEGNHVVVCYKKLMFTEHFFVEITHCYIENKINIKSSFFNSLNECCAEVVKDLKWFDSISREVTASPKKIIEHFNGNAAV